MTNHNFQALTAFANRMGRIPDFNNFNGTFNGLLEQMNSKKDYQSIGMTTMTADYNDINSAFFALLQPMNNVSDPMVKSLSEKLIFGEMIWSALLNKLAYL